MGYISMSKKPTNEKKKLYYFMERNKNRGVVGYTKLKTYLKKNNLRAVYTGKSLAHSSSGYGKKSMMYWYDIKNSRGTLIASFGVKSKKSPRVTWWSIE